MGLKFVYNCKFVWHNVSNLDEPKSESLDEPNITLKYKLVKEKYKKFVI